MESISFATPNEIAALLRQTLMGKNVTVEKIPPFRIPVSEPQATAVYITPDGKVVGLCICDLQLVHRAGAALCMIPTDNRLNSVKLDSALADNFIEVLNICSNLFRDSGGGRITLREVGFAATSRPPDVASIVTTPGSRLDLKLNISDYGVGRMSLLTI